MRNVGICGKHKIANRWSWTVYKVIKLVRDLHYVIVPCDSDGPERALHRDLLLPCGFLSSVVLLPDPKRQAKAARTFQSNIVAGGNNPDDNESDENQSRSTDKEVILIIIILIVHLQLTKMYQGISIEGWMIHCPLQRMEVSKQWSNLFLIQRDHLSSHKNTERKI